MLMRPWAAGLLLLLSGAVVASELPIAACNRVRHSPEALRYQMQGTTVLNLTMNPAGKPIKGSIATGSGWKTLDADALRLARSCRFSEGTEPGTLVVTWALADTATVPPQPVPGSCAASLAYRTAQPGPGTIKVRLLVWTDGQVYAPRIESGSGDDVVDHWALAYAHSCRYAPAVRNGAPVTGTAVLHVAFDPEADSEAAQHALYERSLPVLRAAMTGRVEYAIRYKYMVQYADAINELARLKAGGDYPIPAPPPDQPAIAQPLPPGKRWLLLAMFADSELARALRAAKAPALLPNFYRDGNGYMIVHLDGERPAKPPSFEAMRHQLRAALLSGTGLASEAVPAAIE